MNLAIYGAGGLGRELLDLAEYINKSTKKWNKIFFVILSFSRWSAQKLSELLC